METFKANDNHSIAYCLLGYLCAYYRYYYPVEFLTSFLNNAANEDDIKSGTAYANKLGIKVTLPKWGISKGEYFYDAESRIITKGLTSVKFLSNSISEELYNIANSKEHEKFVDVLLDISSRSSLDTRQLDILIKIDFFSEYGNQRELMRICDLFYNLLKKGCAKNIKKSKVAGTQFDSILKKYSIGTTKSGKESVSYTIVNMDGILHEIEDMVKASGMSDLDNILKIQNFYTALGYYGYSSGREEDRKKLFILDMYPLKRKKDGVQFGYSVITKSIGSGKESRFTLFNRVFEKEPIEKGDIIHIDGYQKDGKYFILTSYHLDF